MRIKQLISLTLFTSLLATAYTGTSLAAETAESSSHHSGVFTGELLETFNSGGYTYVQIETDKGPVWAAGPASAINKDDKVSFIGKVAMTDFYSKSLDRRFKTIYFVDSYIINGEKNSNSNIDPHKNIDKKQAAALKPFSKADNGKNIAEILENKENLAGTKIKIRGQVSKYTAQVLGKNWIHIRDSSSNQDITITTDADAQINDIIVAEGKLVLNKDYGYGYIYEVLIEDAKVGVEAEK